MNDSPNSRVRLPWILFMLLGISTFIGIGFYTVNTKEPFHNGLSLTEWIQKYIDVQGRDAGFPDVEVNNKECTRVVGLMATNAIPFLLAWIQQKDTPIQKYTIAALNRILPMKHRILLAVDRNKIGCLGFRLIGKEGQPAIPALIELTKDKNPNIRINALSCLLDVDAEDQVFMPVLKRCENDPDLKVQQYAKALIICIQFRPKAGGTSF